MAFAATLATLSFWAPAPARLPVRAAVRASAGLADQSFARGNDILSTGPKMSSRQIVNVLGRWTSYTDWDTIGELPAMDALDPDNLPKYSQRIQGRGNLTPEEKLSVSPAKTPQRRLWCKKRGQAQRWWHTANVGLLPFTNEALAASIGTTAASLNAEPVEPLAAEIVFDAISRSQSGITEFAWCDERKAAYTASGGFDAASFSADLAAARLNVVKALCIFPGSLIVTQLAVLYKIDAWHGFLQYVECFPSVHGFAPEDAACMDAYMSGIGSSIESREGLDQLKLATEALVTDLWLSL